jgi:hypothetical protein
VEGGELHDTRGQARQHQTHHMHSLTPTSRTGCEHNARAACGVEGHGVDLAARLVQLCLGACERLSGCVRGVCDACVCVRQMRVTLVLRALEGAPSLGHHTTMSHPLACRPPA